MLCRSYSIKHLIFNVCRLKEVINKIVIVKKLIVKLSSTLFYLKALKLVEHYLLGTKQHADTLPNYCVCECTTVY